MTDKYCSLFIAFSCYLRTLTLTNFKHNGHGSVHKIRFTNQTLVFLPIIICMIYSSIAFNHCLSQLMSQILLKDLWFHVMYKMMCVIPIQMIPFFSCILVLNRKRHVYDLTALDYHYSSWQVVISLKVENFLYLPQWLWSRSLYLEKL